MNVYHYLICLIILSGIVGGGYFAYLSGILLVPMMLGCLYLVNKNKSLRIICNWDSLAIVMLVCGYLVTMMWAVDSGMALTGFMKFLPVLVFWFLLGYTGERIEEIKRFLPLVGTGMTVLGMILTCIPGIRPYIMVAGRFSGSFQYPNTYALFMLVCLITAMDRCTSDDRARFDYLNAAVALIGIFMSGSRITLVLTVLSIVVFGFKSGKKNIKVLVSSMLILIGGFGIVALLNRYAVLHLLSNNMSTLWGRILYVLDAVPYILRHPFGIGYYGYYFVQQQIQTGVYSVVNIHNEFLQIMIDIGWIPAVLFYGVIVKNIVSSKRSFRDRMVLAVILLHSLVDYDLQFLMLFFVLVIFLDVNNIKEFDVSAFTGVILLIFTVVTAVIGFKTGVSDFLSHHGMYAESIRYYDGNTVAKLRAAFLTDSPEERREELEEILEVNQNISSVYSELGNLEFQEGNIERFIYYKDMAIDMAPYQYEEFAEYCGQLYYCGKFYLRNREYESASICVDKMNGLQNKLESLRERTSDPGWKIKDKPQVKFQPEYVQMIEELTWQLK